jgi:hypothetical protein
MHDIRTLITEISEALRDATFPDPQDARDAIVKLRQAADRIENSATRMAEQLRPWGEQPEEAGRISER